MTAIETRAFDGARKPPSGRRVGAPPVPSRGLSGAFRPEFDFRYVRGGLRRNANVYAVGPSSPGRGELPKRVLVADDDADICALLRAALAPLADITTVADAESALELLAAEPPYDAIISDFMLPGITGLEFVKRVRDEEQATHVPILMISGHGSQDVGDRARAAGADAFLDKPFTLDQLRAAVSHLLRGQRIRFA